MIVRERNSNLRVAHSCCGSMPTIVIETSGWKLPAIERTPYAIRSTNICVPSMMHTTDYAHDVHGANAPSQMVGVEKTKKIISNKIHCLCMMLAIAALYGCVRACVHKCTCCEFACTCVSSISVGARTCATIHIIIHCSWAQPHRHSPPLYYLTACTQRTLCDGITIDVCMDTCLHHLPQSIYTRVFVAVCCAQS